MGKNRQAQRTKNNAKPSNSSRSAELLGTAIPTFVGFSAVNDGGCVPVLPGLSLCSSNNAEMNNNLDPTFQVVLKQMNKKDARTRRKALKEFASLCKTAELSAVKSTLPFWPRPYLATAIDLEDRVREAAQTAHAALVERVGKGIEKYLNQVIGTWFICMFDPYPLAASAASNSFNKTFPPSKSIRAIVRYQTEILTYIRHIMFEADSSSLSPQKYFTCEEKEQICFRVLATSMQAYSFYFRKVPRQEIYNTAEIHNKILSSSRFWNLYSQHDLLSVRIAFFNILSSVLENAENLLENEKRRTMTAIINRLEREMDTPVVSAIWESMLLAMTKLTDWHLVVDVKKFVLPKVWKSMEYGGDGCASTAYPNLLPFVSQFPKLSTDVRSLYSPFFSCLRKGFSANQVRKSRSETQAVAQAFVECFRYSIHVNAEDVDLCIWLFKEQLVPVIAQACQCTRNEYAYDEYKINGFMRHFCFPEIAHLVRHWSKNRSSGEHKESYAALMREFWIELRQWFDSGHLSCGKINKNYQIEFLLTLKNPPNRVRKKSKMVKFSNSDSDPVPSQSETRVVDADASFESELCEFVSGLCTVYFEKIGVYEQRWPICLSVVEHIDQLNTLLRHFASRELFTMSMFVDSKDRDFFKFYDENLKPLVLQSSKDVMEQSLELIFHLIPHIDDAEKDKILKSLTNLNDIRITRNVIYRSLSKRNRNDRVVKNWYNQADIIKLLIDVAAEIAASEDDSSNLEKRDLILLAFETSETGELLISDDGANEIVSILCDSLSGRDDVCSATFVEFVDELMTSTWNHKRTITNAVQILETMFELCTREHDDQHATIVETTRKCWKKGFARSAQLLSADEFNDLVHRCATIIWSKVYNGGHAKDTLVDLATDIFEIAIDTAKSSPHCTEETVLLFLTSFDIKSWIAEATAVAIYGEIVTGDLYVSNLERKIRIFGDHTLIDISNNNVILDNMTNCLCWALFTTDLLNTLYERLRSVKSNGAEENPEAEEDDDDDDLNVPGITELLINIIYVASVREIYSKHYKSTKSYNDVNKLFESFNISLVTLRKYYAKNIRDDVSSHLQTNRSSYGYMLPYMIHMYRTEFESLGVNEVAWYYENCTSGAEEHEEACLQASQILGDCWNVETSSTNDITHASIVARTALCQQNVSPDNIAKHCDLTMIMSCHKDDPALLLQDRDVFDVPWSQLLLPLEVVRLLATLVRKAPSALKSEHWDFILLSLVAWQQSIKKSIHKRVSTDVRVTSLITAVGQLYCSIQTLMNKHKQKPMPELPPTLLDEWKNVFAGDVQSAVAQTWMYCVDLHDQDNTDIRFIVLLDRLGKSISVLDGNVLFKEEKRHNSVDFDNMLRLSLKLLQSPTSSVQLGAYHALKCMTSEIGKRDTKIVESDSLHIERSSLNFKKLEDVLLSTQNIVNIMLMDFKLCDTISCTIEPFTDSYTYALGYLLTWTIVLDLCKNAHDDLRYHYAEMVKNHLFPSLLKNIFKLMPMEVLQGIKNKTAGKLLDMFTTEPSLDFGESWTEWRLDHIVCWVYTNCLRCLPVLVRQWLNTADSKVSATVDKITSYYVSPVLCQEKLSDKRLKRCENLKVKVSTRQIVGVYEMEDAKLELVIVLPSNYPLGAVEVVQNNACGSNFTNSFSQLAIFLTHQNGDIWEGLMMWKRILDKKFASVDDCCICFSIFHHNTHQLPKLSCQTCPKKFHTSCLYQWFNTSQKSTCPNCRTVF